ncbi:MAG: alpha/beta hydrolase fold domain-containing protein [Anaerolineae bacterium]|jgi:acetyl esterase/lipase|nr:alpha/beta hydrolase [Chloroflexota bacterium]
MERKTVNEGVLDLTRTTPAAVLARYAGRRRLYPQSVMRATNPDLDHRYIRRKWLNVPYAQGCPRALMDIYLPNDGEGPFPVILFAHGGGYFTGRKDDYETYPPLEGLKRGYAVCAIDYTLSGEALFPRPLQEAKAAVRFIRANAARYRLDPSCLIAWGMSAGANLAALLALTGDGRYPELDDPAMGWADQPSHVDACMIWFCPTTFAMVEAQLAQSGLQSAMITRGDDYVLAWELGLPVEDAPDLAALVNPETYITPQAPPFVIQHGRQDVIVPWQQGERLASRLRAAIGEERVRWTLFEDYDHADRRFETMHNCSLVLDQLEALLGRG